MKFHAAFLALVGVASTHAWMPPSGTVKQFTPEIPHESHDLSWCATVSKKAAVGSQTDAALDCYMKTLEKEGIQVEITSDVVNAKTDIRHVYLRQVVNGMSVENAMGNINIKGGKIISNYNRFTKNVFTANLQQNPDHDGIWALKEFTRRVLHREVPESIAVVSDAHLPDEHDLVMETGSDDFEYQPMYADRRLFQDAERQLHAVWEVNVDFEDSWYDAVVDIETGETLQLVDFVHWYNYNVYPHTVADPEDLVNGELPKRELLPEHFDDYYSPRGWHTQGNTNFDTTRGNNVNAQENRGGGTAWENNYRPTANGNNFDYELDLTKEPAVYEDAAITSLFYHCNVFHDFTYVYGFDEVSGNFQFENFGRGGRERDPVTANAQDGSGYNNANFATPADGSAGRMRMYLWNGWKPMKDGDFDAGIIYHEFGHGLSNRLTGGPSTTTCLGTTQAGGMGEGWSDFIGYMWRQRVGNNRNMVFGTGSYIVPGNTIRNWPYSSNMTVAPQTYSYMSGQPIHQIGAVWCTLLLEPYWNFVEEYGFDPNWITPDGKPGQGGNNMFMTAVVEGMKLQPCRPTIVDARDAILDAIENIYDEKAWCLAWQGFAKRGLGVGAPANRYTNSFIVPPQCQ